MNPVININTPYCLEIYCGHLENIERIRCDTITDIVGAISSVFVGYGLYKATMYFFHLSSSHKKDY